MSITKENMIHNQIKCWDCTNQKAIDILRSIDRAQFIPDDKKEFCYADISIPIGLKKSETLLEPKIYGRILQTICDQYPTGINHCLIVGSGTGYLPTLISKMSKHVTGYEISDSMFKIGEENIKNSSADNITLKHGNGLKYNPEEIDKFDCIILCASSNHLPNIIGEKLQQNCSLIAFIGEPPITTMQLINKLPSGAWEYTSILDTNIPSLDCVLEEQKFEF